MGDDGGVIWFVALQIVAVPAVPFDLATVGGGAGAATVVPRCGADRDGDGGDIVVCGRSPDRFRLPLPVERAAVPGERGAGEAATAASVLVPAGRCGLFAGEHRCNKAEAARYGYGGGRDPVTTVTRLATRLIDPDAELEPLGKGP